MRPLNSASSRRRRAWLHLADISTPRFAKRNVVESLPDLRPRLHPSGLMLAARITLPHFSASSLMSLPKSAGEPASAAAPYRARLKSVGVQVAPFQQARLSERAKVPRFQVG